MAWERNSRPRFLDCSSKAPCERSCFSPAVRRTWFQACSQYVIIGESPPWVVARIKRNDVCGVLGMWWVLSKVHYCCYYVVFYFNLILTLKYEEWLSVYKYVDIFHLI